MNSPHYSPNKIGVAIKPNVAGNFRPVVANRGEWVRKVRDVRAALQHVPAVIDNHNVIVMMLTFDETGCFIILARTVNDIDLSNISGWIYIPNNIKISGREVVRIIREVRNLISGPTLPDHETLERLFGERAYETGESAVYESSSANKLYAKRSTVNYPLELLVGEYRYQPYYSSFEAVFINTDNLFIEDAQDISSYPLELPTVMDIYYPEVDDAVIVEEEFVHEPPKIVEEPVRAPVTPGTAATRAGSPHNQSSEKRKIGFAPYGIGGGIGLAIGLTIGFLIAFAIFYGKKAGNAASDDLDDAIVMEVNDDEPDDYYYDPYYSYDEYNKAYEDAARETEKAMKQAQRETEKAMKQAQRETEKAIEDARKETERIMNSLNYDYDYNYETW